MFGSQFQVTDHRGREVTAAGTEGTGHISSIVKNREQRIHAYKFSTCLSHLI